MLIGKTGVETRGATTLISAWLLCVSCGAPEQGSWTKQGSSQAFTDEQYAADSQHCDRFAAQNDGRESDKARSKRYTKCMSARGGLNPEVNQSITREDSSHPKANLPPDPSHRSNEQRLVKDRECRQQAAATLSSPYAVYLSCMQENRSSPPPAIGATPSSAEHEQPDPYKGHAREEIALPSAAGNMEDDNQKIASASGKMVTADPAEHEPLDPRDPLERIGLDVQSGARNIGDVFSKIGSAIGRPLEAVGRGLQSAFRNIGDEIAEIGSRIGNLFKHLSGNDTRDKEQPSNTRVAPPPRDQT